MLPAGSQGLASSLVEAVWGKGPEQHGEGGMGTGGRAQNLWGQLVRVSMEHGEGRLLGQCWAGPMCGPTVRKGDSQPLGVLEF